MKYTHIIWDFNGTILDDVEIGIESVNALLRRRELPTIPNAEYYRSIFCFPIIKYYEKLGFDFSSEPFSELAVEWVNEYMSRVPQAKTCRGAVELLEKVHGSPLGQVLVSATEREMLAKQLSMLGITELFDGVYGLDNIHAVNKTAIACAWRAENRDAKPLFIGDTDHDLETAKAINADCVLFCGGHQSRERLELLGCPVVDDLSVLEDMIFS